MPIPADAARPEESCDDASPPQWRQRIEALRNVPPVFKLVWESAPTAVTWSLLLRLFTSFVPLGVLKVTQLIVDSVYALSAQHRALPDYFWWLVVLEFVLASLAAMLGRITDFCDTVLADNYTRHVSTRIMQHAARLDLTRYEDASFYDKMERARVQGTDRVLMIQMTGRLLQEGITTLGLAVGIFLFSPWLLFILIVSILPAFAGQTHFAFQGYALNFLQTPARRQMDYLRILAGSKESAKELKLFRLGSFLVQRYRTLFDKIHRQNVDLAKRKLFYGGFLSVLGTLGYYGTYAYVVYQTVSGHLSIGQLTFLAGAIAGASTNIQAFFSTFSGIADQALFMTDLLEFFAVRPTILSKPGAFRAPRPIRKGLEFRNVWFRYPGTQHAVLRDVSFHLESGQRLALVGENGEGKTTIAKLLTRLYDPTQGQILLDGIDLREYDLEDWWDEIGIIFQDFVRYEMTAGENIGVGRIEICKYPYPPQIRTAARKSYAETVIGKLPHKYDQLLGVRFEGGVDLSGGEWQRIALARAHLRDAQLLILDEPTAALDARSERDVFERFVELTEGKTTLLISHRFSTVRMADRILVLAGGKIEEQGAHEELLKGAGRYAEMFELQAAGYR